jgi:LuxR family maltose regulon positive regulatory protein
VVTLIAPAGYGKTTALLQALRSLPQGTPIAWLRADPDDDLQRFLSSLAAALDPYDLPWRASPDALAAIADRAQGFRRIADELCLALAGAGVTHGVIAIDDLECIGDTRVLRVLDLVQGALPEAWTLVLASRVDPPLSLARRWVEGTLAEFRQSDLRFSLEEVKRLIGTAHGSVGEGEAERLLRDADGWAAGLCLALSGHGSAPAGARLGRRHLYEYLAAEVLNDMPAGLRDFLLRCSVLPELSASRCVEVSRDPRAVAWLREIERRGLFVSVLSDGPELTLKLHDLFRSFLEDQLLRRQPEELPLLLRRAAAGEEDVTRKVELLLQAGAWEVAEQVLVQAMSSALSVTDRPQLSRLIECFPAGLRESSPALAYLRGLAAWPVLEYETMLDNMRAAANGFDASGQGVPARRARAYQALALFMAGRVEEAHHLSLAVRQGHELDLEGHVACTLFDHWYTLLQGPAGGPAEQLSRLTDLLIGAPAELWNRCMPVLIGFVGRPGYRAALERFVREGLRVAGDSNLPLRAALEHWEASAHVFRADLARAGPMLRRLREDCAWLGRATGGRVNLLFNVADVLAGEQHPGRTLDSWIDAMAAARGPRSMLTRNSLEVIARINAANGQWDAARDAVRIIEAHGPFPEGVVLRFPTDILRARFALEEGDTYTVRALLRPLMGPLLECDRCGTDAYVRITLAVAELRSGAVREAWAVLEPAIERTAESGQLAALVFPGIELLAELVHADWRDVADPRALEQLSLWLDHLRALRAGARPGDAAALARRRSEEASSDRPVPTLGELSHRELEVLQCIAAGESNKAIARRLGLSPHTVKRHVARILDRIEVSSRGQAACWYHDRMRSN